MTYELVLDSHFFQNFPWCAVAEEGQSFGVKEICVQISVLLLTVRCRASYFTSLPAPSSPTPSPVEQGLVLSASTVHGPGRQPSAPDPQLPCPPIRAGAVVPRGLAASPRSNDTVRFPDACPSAFLLQEPSCVEPGKHAVGDAACARGRPPPSALSPWSDGSLHTASFLPALITPDFCLFVWTLSPVTRTQAP